MRSNVKRGMKSLFRKHEDWTEFEYDPDGTRQNRHRHKVHEGKKGQIRSILKRESDKEIEEGYKE